MGNILEEIAKKTIERVEAAKSKVPSDEVRALAEEAQKAAPADGKLSADKAAGADGKSGGNIFPFEDALREPEMTFICEAKKASPSKGLIEPDFHPVEIAIDYEAAGAGAISVLTEPYYFQGSLDYLKDIRKNVSIPLLRKDFTVDEYMIYEAKAAGADIILLICAILDEGRLKAFRELADELGLSAIVEAHDEAEIEKGLNAGARIIGVNNRNLKDFTVDVGNGIKLRKYVPEDALFIAESGIKTADDIKRLREGNVNGVLIGETLMRAKDKRAMLNTLRGK